MTSTDHNNAGVEPQVKNHRESTATAALPGVAGRPSDPGGPLARLAEVVDRGAADVDRREVLFHPVGDLLRRARPVVPGAAVVVTGDEVPHLVVGDIALELR